MNARLEELRIKFQENPRRYFAPFANELRKAGDAAQAIAICRTHLAGQPGHVSGHIVLGQALYEAAQSAEASDVFTAALELDPENLIALRTMGEIAQVNGDFPSARRWYERLLDADPRNAEVVQLLRDLPTASTTAESSFAPPVHEQPLEAEPSAPLVTPASEAPPPPSGFHTTFTGVASAYEPRDRWEPPAATPEPILSTEPAAAFAPDREEPAPGIPEPSDESIFELPSAEAEAAPPAAEFQLDAIDSHAEVTEIQIGAEGMQVDAAELHADLESFAVLPDEALAPPLVEASAIDAAMDIDLEAPGSADAPQAVTDEPAQAAAEIEAAPEPPRALFAEHGFEGEAERRDEWITPSAAYSDLEAAPEDWFAEPAEASSVESELPGAAAETESMASAMDSWFEEGPTAAAAAVPEEGGAEEYWMPDFASVGAGSAAQDDATVPTAELSQAPVDGPMAAFDGGAGDAIAEPPRVEVEAFEDLAAEAVAVDHPVAAEAASYAEEAIPVAAADLQESKSISEPELAFAEGSTEAEAEDAGLALAEEAMAGSVSAADVFSPTAETAYPDPSVGHTPTFNSAVPAGSPAPAPFVTETLAELYLQQGFKDEALAIYRQLADRDPSDQSLRIRISAIEEGAASDVMQAADAPVTTRPTVRSFFSRLAHRIPVVPAASPEPASAPEVPFAAAASALANLFAASKPPAADEGAAATLSSAFTDPAGRPSRAADRELSLDHLFRDVPPGGQGASGVNLDEFYASPVPASRPDAPTPSGEGGAAPESEGTDIRQFTAWLEGLRKK